MAITKLKLVLATLDGITVSGHENWDRLLGCYQAIEDLITEMESAPEETEVVDNG